MTQVAAERRKTSFRRETGAYLPRSFSLVSRERFHRDRRQRHLRRVSGSPTEAQISMAQTLASMEWAALSAERQNTLQSLREAREHRRLLLRVLGDFERSLVPKPAASPHASISEYYADVVARRQAAE
jgi:multidrug efflux pump subunit AcrA (membrane-fusion protein)